MYSQLQTILPDSVLGSISDWDSYLNLDLTQADLPFKSADDFVLNSDFHRIVTSSKLPRPSKFIDQSIAFYKAFCRILLQHKIVKSDLIRGLTCFDSAMILDGGEDRYVSAIEQLTSHFTSHGSITASDKTKAVSQYRALVVKFRSSQIDLTVDWFTFLSGHDELHCRPELHQVFKYACLCLPPMAKIPVRFEVPIPELGPDEELFQSCVTSLQVSYATVPNVCVCFVILDPLIVSSACWGKATVCSAIENSPCGISLEAVGFEGPNCRRSLRIHIKVWLQGEKKYSFPTIPMFLLLVIHPAILVHQLHEL